MHTTPLAAALATALAASSGSAAVPTGAVAQAQTPPAPSAPGVPSAPAAPAPSTPTAAAPAAGPTPTAPSAAPAAAAATAAPAAAAATDGTAPTPSSESTKPGLRHRAHKTTPAAPAAAAVTPTDTPAPATFSLPAATLSRVDLWIGVRDELIKDRSYDPYSTDDQLPMFQARAGVGLGALGTAGLAAVASLAVGDSSASDRGASTDLHVLRVGLGPELRIPAFDRLYVLGRVQPEAVHVSTDLHDNTGDAHLANSGWSFGLDAALGAALRLVDIPTGESTAGIGVFLRLEAGYSWTASHQERLAASGSDAPLRSAPLGLGDLALRGASFGGAIGLGY